MEILIIDDSEAAQIAFEQVFTNEGYAVTTAGTAEEGLQSIRKKAPDLIILDVQLPDILGTQLCEMLKKDPTTRYIPILMCTGHKAIAHGLNVGADDYLIKPCGKDEMVARVSALLRRVEMAEERAREKESLKHRQAQVAGHKPAAASPLQAPRPAAAAPAGKRRRALLFAWMSLAYPLESLARLDEFPLTAALTPVLLACLFGTAVRLAGSHAEPWPHAAFFGCAGPVSLWAATALFSVLLVPGMHWKDLWPNMARVCAAAAAPLAMRGLLTWLYVLACDGVPADFNASPLLLASALHARPALLSWLGRCDLFALWSAALVALGARRAGKLSLARSVWAGTGAWAVWVLAQEAGRWTVWGP
jgi:CheY-like chemotaxis protein